MTRTRSTIRKFSQIHIPRRQWRPGMCLLCLFTSMLPQARSLYAQSRLGPVVGYEYSLPLDISRIPGSVNRFGFSGGGRAYNHAASAGLTFVETGALGSAWDLYASLLLRISSGSFISDLYASSVIDTTTAGVVPTQNRFTVDALAAGLRLEAGTRLRITDGFLAGVGAWGGWRGREGIRLTESIVLPDSVAFAEGQRSRVIAAGDELASDRFGFGAAILLGGSIPFGGGGAEMLIEGFLGADADALLNGLGAKALYGGGRISLLLPVAPSNPLSSPAQANTDVPIPAMLANVNLLAIDGSDTLATATLTPHRRLHRRTVPIFPHVPFDNGLVIPDRYVQLSPEVANRFSLDSLVGLGIADVHHQMLNIVGLRMRQGHARLSIVGLKGNGTSETAARTRAEHVAAYFRHVWGLPDARLRVLTAPTRGSADGDEGVDLRTTDAHLLDDPLRLEWVVRELHAPRIALDHSMIAEAGVLRWSIVVSRGSDVIASYSPQHNGPFDAIEGSFRVVPDDGSAPAPLVADLTLVDSTGRILRSHDELPVVIAPESQHNDIASEQFDGIIKLPYSNGSPRFDATTIKLLAEIVSAIRDGAVIVVTPAADGSEYGDLRAVVAVVTEILDGLERRGVIPQELNAGEIPGLPGALNSLPEAKMLSGSVQYKIVQSVNR